MIRAFIFDLDGVLVQTEKLKARAYDLAVQEILGTEAPDQRAGQAYAEVIGASRETTSRYVMEKLGLECDIEFTTVWWPTPGFCAITSGRIMSPS
jgi:beta-phosphoglucomutase-like phosphatase (HAD superfamily)